MSVEDTKTLQSTSIDPAWADAKPDPIVVHYGVRTLARALHHDKMREAVRRTREFTELPILEEQHYEVIGFDGIQINHTCSNQAHEALAYLQTEWVGLMYSAGVPLVIAAYGQCQWNPVFIERPK